MASISTIIVIKDNPPYVMQSLASIADISAEILIGDIGMAPELKAALVKMPKIQILSLDPIPYVELVREELKKIAKSDYVLFLDPDEIIPQDLKQELFNKMGSYDYCSIPRKNIIMGKWITHSRWWPDYQVRFFKKDAVTWPTEIHKQPSVTGTELKLEPIEKLAILHYNYGSLDEYLAKAIRYAKAEAGERFQKKDEYSFGDAAKNALSEFVSRFFALDGYKDGMHGFVLATLQMFYAFLVYFYYWEMKKYPEVRETELTDTVAIYFKQGFKESGHWMNEKKLQKKSVVRKIAEKTIGL